jgi:hypothetical protein
MALTIEKNPTVTREDFMCYSACSEKGACISDLSHYRDVKIFHDGYVLYTHRGYGYGGICHYKGDAEWDNQTLREFHNIEYVALQYLAKAHSYNMFLEPIHQQDPTKIHELVQEISNTEQIPEWNEGYYWVIPTHTGIIHRFVRRNLENPYIYPVLVRNRLLSMEKNGFISKGVKGGWFITKGGLQELSRTSRRRIAVLRA